MKKTIKFLLASLLMLLMFSCLIIEDYRETTFYNETGETQTYLYVIPESEFPSLYTFMDDESFISYCSEWYEDQLGYNYLYNGSSIDIDLDSISPIESNFVVVSYDGYTVAIEHFTDYETSVTLNRNDYYWFY